MAQSWAEAAAGVGALGALFYAVRSATHTRFLQERAQANLVLVSQDLEEPAQGEVWATVYNNSDQPVFGVSCKPGVDVGTPGSLLESVERLEMSQAYYRERLDAHSSWDILCTPVADLTLCWTLARVSFVDAEGRPWVREFGGSPVRDNDDGWLESFIVMAAIDAFKRRRERGRGHRQ